MAEPTPTLDALRRRYVADLIAAGALTDPAWRSVFAAVPRHAFVPVYHRTRLDEAGALVHEQITSEHPDWLSEVYSDQALSVRRDVTSSSTSPPLMARMLESLQLTGTERVLEIGTGTGYNTALLCARLGADRVTSIDIDPDLVDDARSRLSELGYQPQLRAGDGAAGYAGRGPYDRIIATCRADLIPPEWIAQLRLGGIIVAPVGTGVATLTRAAPGAVTGWFEPYSSYFMPIRGTTDRDRLATVARRAATDRGTTGSTTLDMSVYSSRDARFWLELAVPGTVRASMGDTDLVYHQDGSWARLVGGTVTQGGPRLLWSEIETAHTHWHQHENPDPRRIGITIDPTGQRIWLDSPDEVIYRAAVASERDEARELFKCTDGPPGTGPAIPNT